MREIACPLGLALSPGGLAAIGVSPLMYAQPGLSAERIQRSLSSNRMGDVQQLPQVWRGGAGAFIACTFTPRLAEGWRTGWPALELVTTVCMAEEGDNRRRL